MEQPQKVLQALEAVNVVLDTVKTAKELTHSTFLGCNSAVEGQAFARSMEELVRRDFTDAQLQDPRSLQIKFTCNERGDKVFPANLFTAIYMLYSVSFSEAERMVSEGNVSYDPTTGDITVRLIQPIEHIDVQIRMPIEAVDGEGLKEITGGGECQTP